MVIATDYPLLEIIWTMFVLFGFVLWFSLLIRVFSDLFRRDDISGWAKFAWSIFVLVLPLIGVLWYLGSRGPEMAQRELEETRAQQAAYAAYMVEQAKAKPQA